MVAKTTKTQIWHQSTKPDSPGARRSNGFLRHAKWNSRQVESLDELIEKTFDDQVRKERRNLMAISSLSIFIAFSQSTPTEISLLIFKMNQIKPVNIYLCLFLFQIYALLAFWLYALPQFRRARKGWAENGGKRSLEIDSTEVPWDIHFDNMATSLRYNLWLLFEYLLPLILCLIATFFLIFRIWHHS